MSSGLKSFSSHIQMMWGAKSEGNTIEKTTVENKYKKM